MSLGSRALLFADLHHGMAGNNTHCDTQQFALPSISTQNMMEQAVAVLMLINTLLEPTSDYTNSLLVIIITPDLCCVPSIIMLHGFVAASSVNHENKTFVCITLLNFLTEMA